MVQLEINKLKKSFGYLEVLKNISFTVQHGDKIGIVGANGSGKSTLLNLIEGLDEADGGSIYINKKCSIQLLGQDAAIRKTSDTKFESSGFRKNQKYLKLLGMNSDEIDLEVLSGGEQTKVVLSEVLEKNPTLLLLDEPTNNMDYYAINKLVNILNFYVGSILVVSHDRYFLDQVVDRIIEIEDGISTEYRGNYTEYKIEKSRRFDEQMHQYEESKKRQKHISDSILQTKQWSNKAHQNSTKPDSSGVKMGAKEKKRSKAKKIDKRMKNYVKRLEKLKAEEIKKPASENTVRFYLDNASTQGKRIIYAENIKKSYGQKILFEKSSFYIGRGEKIAVFGPNGCGKSTLIKLIQGKINLDNGELWISPSYVPFVLEQTFTDYDTKFTVLEYLAKKYGSISGESRTMLNNLGLSARHLNQMTSTLSYGEQMKLKLAESILDQKNFIILDEPTNHLDLKSREMMEKTLIDYQGTLFIVSHDIYFLKKICNKVLYFKDETIVRSEYDFSQFLCDNEFISIR